MDIFEAAAKGNVQYIEELIKEGGHVNLKDSNHFTPLMLAAKNGQFEMIKLLVNHGAIDLPNWYNITAATEANKLAYSEISIFLELHKTIIDTIARSITKLLEKQPLSDEENYNLIHFFFGLNIDLLATKIHYPMKVWHQCIIEHLKGENIIEKETSAIIEEYQIYYDIDAVSIADEDSQDEDDLCYSDLDSYLDESSFRSTTEPHLYDQWPAE